MKNISSKSIVYFILFDSFLFWFLADFFSKRWAISDQFNSWSLIDGFFYLIPFQKNEGIAFSIPIPLWLQVTGSVVIIFFLTQLGLKYILAETQRVGLKTFFLGMALGGGMGNLVDRVSQHYVVDFIVLGPIPVFNVADVGITVGLIGLFATMLLESKTNIKS